MSSKKVLFFVFALIVVGLAANAYPGVVVCAFAGANSFQSPVQERLLQKAKKRIEGKFGSVQANPIVILFDEKNAFWPLKLNEYGSTSFLGTKTCVSIGPKGQNVDVVAHELMHAETAYRVGYWRRFNQLPVWFDEGLAMQVDYRKRYDLSDSVETKYVTYLNSSRDFFVANNRLLISHYASAKSEVALWITKVGEDSVYRHLSRIESGETFDSVWHDENKELTKPSGEYSR